MQPFLYRRATSRDDAAQQLASPGAMSLGGGTDLLVAIAEEIARPDLLVDLRRIPGSEGIAERYGSIRIGASTRIAAIAADAIVRDRFPALSQACDVVGTPAL